MKKEFRIDEMVEKLRKNGNFQIKGFGTFKVKEMQERKGRNPKTGQELIIPATIRISFKAHQGLIEQVKLSDSEIEKEDN